MKYIGMSTIALPLLCRTLSNLPQRLVFCTVRPFAGCQDFQTSRPRAPEAKTTMREESWKCTVLGQTLTRRGERKWHPGCPAGMGCSAPRCRTVDAGRVVQDVGARARLSTASCTELLWIRWHARPSRSLDSPGRVTVITSRKTLSSSCVRIACPELYIYREQNGMVSGRTFPKSLNT